MLEISDSKKLKLLQEINHSWPAEYRLTFNGNIILNLNSHKLAEEITSFICNQSCCLPYFRERDKEISWFNIATNADELQGTIQALRCWLIPSYGWEDERGWVVTKELASTGLAKNILEMSPPGYCRWNSKQSEFQIIVKKLSQMRFLEKARPDLPPNGPPPLIQIRQQFVTALVAGDKLSAEQSIRLVDTHQLDSADNSLFMWIRYWFTFREYGKIVKHKDINRLTQLLIPTTIKRYITSSFYYEHLENFDWENDTDNILTSYKLDIEPVIGGLISCSAPEDGIETIRLLACQAIIRQMPDLTEKLLSFTAISCLRHRIELNKKLVNTQEQTLEDQFWNARAQKNWLRLQEVGAELVTKEPETYSTLLRHSLKFNANPELSDILNKLDKQELNIPSNPAHDINKAKPTPKNWIEWLSLANDDPSCPELRSLLIERHPIKIETLSLEEIRKTSQNLEILFLRSDLNSHHDLRQLLLTGLPELIHDLVNESKFPRDILTDVYANIFRLWSELKCGSTHAPDSQVLLNLADGILTYQRELESEIVKQFETWWNKSPVKTNLPFLLGVVDLLNSKGTEEQCGNFWILGATFLQSKPKYLTPGERNLWRQIGIQIFDQITIDEYLPLPSENDTEVDPLKTANLKKVAIVSMREPQAANAAKMIEQRTGANVHLITSKSAGAQTENALNAEVVLFVWRATSHAIFRAFDKIEKEKIAYVQGTGAGSILLTLERWVAERITEQHI